jgi:hypothetical protein
MECATPYARAVARMLAPSASIATIASRNSIGCGRILQYDFTPLFSDTLYGAGVRRRRSAATQAMMQARP